MLYWRLCPTCGILDSANNPNLEDSVSYYFPWAAQIISSWAIYAQDCYLNVSDLGSCNAFIQPQLPVQIDRNASCPFQDGICESEYGNMAFDTYLDSHVDLGLNAPAHERVRFRRVSSCAPVKMDGHRSMFRSPETEMNYTRYYYGPTTGRNFTYEYPEVSWRSTPSRPGAGSNGGGRYTVEVKSGCLYNGSYTDFADYDPIPALRQPDADVHLIFLSANSILYTQKVDDPWYAATTNSTTITSAEYATGRVPAYRADQPVSVLACSVKEQYCNPNLASGEQCSPFGGTYESPSLADGLWKNSKQRTSFGWKIPSAAYSNFSVFGLCLTLALGSVIVCLSYTLEPLASWIQKRRKSRAPNYACLEWATNETLQLQRQAYEQSGIGVWEGCASRVPVTKGGERLAVLDLENPHCPRLRAVVEQDHGQKTFPHDNVDAGRKAPEDTATEVSF
ncbi:hypothetical protein SLS55_008152 [Diplodia seriata]|uniref:Uncharacterized protein n=1 Tax=Diplodia seriata TaxID=420778 RepID=A0ABR3CAL6_9PEZI